MTDAALNQLLDQIEAKAILPLAGLLGTDLVGVLGQRLRQAAPRILSELAEAEVDVLPDLIFLLWGDGDPDPEWWRTALGRLCARAMGGDEEVVTHAQAAAMLGVTRGTIAQMVNRGNLDRHPDGGVLRGSVLQRIGRQS